MGAHTLRKWYPACSMLASEVNFKIPLGVSLGVSRSISEKGRLVWGSCHCSGCRARELRMTWSFGWAASLWVGGLQGWRKRLTFRLHRQLLQMKCQGWAASLERELGELASCPMYLRLSYWFSGDSMVMAMSWTHTVHFKNPYFHLLLFFVFETRSCWTVSPNWPSIPGWPGTPDPTSPFWDFRHASPRHILIIFFRVFILLTCPK